MFINISYIKHQLSLRKQNKVSSDDLGSIIKHKRLEEHLTLEEGAMGICSVSYLSKVENNLIKPSSKYVTLLKQKFGIEDQSSLLDPEMFEKLITEYFDNDILDIEDNNKNGYDYKSKLYSLALLILNKKYEESYRKYFDLNMFIKNMDNLELELYLYLTAKLLRFEDRMKDAFVCLDLIKTNIHDKLNILVDKEKIELATLMNNHPYILINYDKLMNKLINREYYKHLHDIKYRYMLYLSQFLCVEDLKTELKKMKNIDEDHKQLIFSYNDYLNMRYNQSYQRLKGKENKGLTYFMMTLFVLNKMQDKDKIQKLLETPYNVNGVQAKMIIEYLKLKYLDKKQGLYTYIRNHILKANDTPDRIDYLNFWYEEGVESFKSKGFYKDATIFMQQILRKIKHLSSVND